LATTTEIGRPITRLLSKQPVFNWTQECSTAFQYIKLQLSSNPVLYNPGWSRLFILNPSAGKHAIAYILLQNNASGRAHPIYYGSRLMSICEQKYIETEKHMVVLLYRCIKYKHYLITNNFPVEVQSPNEGLKAAMNQAYPEGRVFCFLTALQQFDLIFKYEKGQRALQADLFLELGRPTASRKGTLSDEDSTLEVFILEEEDDLMAEYGSIINLLRSVTYPVGATIQDWRKLRRLSRPYTIRGGNLYYTRRDMIQRRVITHAETKTVIMQCHDGLCGGHFATDTTFRKILMAGSY
jgi:hypothetical protein